MNRTDMQEDKGTPFLWRFVFPLLCAVSLILYVCFSKGLRFLLSGWNYHNTLFKMVFPDGFFPVLARDVQNISNFTVSRNDFLIYAFWGICFTTAMIIHRLIKASNCEKVPHLILFTFASAIVPTLLLAIIYWPDGRGNLSIETSILVSISIFGILFFLMVIYKVKPKINSDASKELKSTDSFGWTLLFLIMLIVMFVFVFLRGFYSYGGYDAVAYHLPLAASWLRFSRITRGFDIQFDYPGNEELLIRWFLSGDSDRFAFLVPYVAAIFCIYMIYKIAILIGQDRKHAMVSACCTATFPVIPFLATTAYTDLMGLLFLLLSTFFIILWLKNEFLFDSHLFSAGLAVGVAVGTKYSMLPFAFSIVLVAVIFVLRSNKIWKFYGSGVFDVSVNWAWLIKKFLIFFSALFLGGGYWYLRNWVDYANPFYPVSIFGLPGRSINSIVDMHVYFQSNPFLKFLYPWGEQTYEYPYDDGVGAVAAAIVVFSIIVWPFLPKNRKLDKTQDPVGSNVVYLIAVLSIALFIWSNNMMMRIGIYPIAICFIFVGETLKLAPSNFLRGVIFSSFMIASIAITYCLYGGFLYEYLRSEQPRAERLHVPAIIDTIPASRIFNAASGYNTYGLLGYDYRHEVVTLFRETEPEDVITYDASYVLLTEENKDRFREKVNLEFVGITKYWESPVSLWRVIGK